MERIESGIPGLDRMIDGGFPFPSVILISGEPGTGKSTFGIQSLFYGAKKGETGLYISAISEPSWVMQSFMSEFEFYDQKLVDTDSIIFIDIGDTLDNEIDIFSEIEKNIERYSPKRVLIDPISAIQTVLEKDIEYRKFLHELILYLKCERCLTFITTEYPYEQIPVSMEAYMVDSVIILSYLEIENTRKKYLEILKMRGTNHLTGKRSMVISKKGIRVQPEFR
ncbi:MAG: KaiA-binding protein [Candidatus Altiarchaeales archaeon]|nr:MAG: KaiA-binding protein [Candidatus Altiarchaeales archaeon]